MPLDPFLAQSQDHGGPEMPSLKAGQVLFNRRYELKQPLGAGGMGMVWLARDHTELIDVALKFLPSVLVLQDREIQRLREEVRAGKELRHPRLVATYGMEIEEGIAAIVMEYVSGQTLRQRLDDKPRGFFEPEEIISWVMDVCDALTYLHDEAKRIHRDLKPANVMIDGEGRAKLMDFGISHRIKESVSRHSKTSEGEASSSSSTMAYASPQQLSGKPSDKADDIYSLGATLYELLTGTPPFYRGGSEAVALQIKTEPVTPMMNRRQELMTEGVNSGTGQKLNKAWERAVLGCLVKTRGDRPATASDVVLLLRSAKSPEPRRLKMKRALIIGAISFGLAAWAFWPNAKVVSVAQTVTKIDAPSSHANHQPPASPPSVGNASMARQQTLPKLPVAASTDTASISAEQLITLESDFNKLIKEGNESGAQIKFTELKKRIKDSAKIQTFEAKLIELNALTQIGKCKQTAIQEMSLLKVESGRVLALLEELAVLSLSPNPSVQAEGIKALEILARFIARDFTNIHTPDTGERQRLVKLLMPYIDIQLTIVVMFQDVEKGYFDRIPELDKILGDYYHLSSGNSKSILINAVPSKIHKIIENFDYVRMVISKEKYDGDYKSIQAVVDSLPEKLKQAAEWALRISGLVKTGALNEALTVLSADGWTKSSGGIRVPDAVRFPEKSSAHLLAAEVIRLMERSVGLGMLKKGAFWSDDETWANDLSEIKSLELHRIYAASIQEKLGLPVDGHASHATIMAILKLEKESSKELTGKISKWLLKELKVTLPDAKAAASKKKRK